MTSAIVHDPGDIERLLKAGLAPLTDNAAALEAMGFERSYPQFRTGYESTIYERAVDLGYRQTAQGLRRVLGRERAFLVAKAPR